MSGRFQGIRAHELGKAVGMVGRRGPIRPLLIESNRDSTVCELQRALTACQPAADYDDSILQSLSLILGT